MSAIRLKDLSPAHQRQAARQMARTPAKAHAPVAAVQTRPDGGKADGGAVEFVLRGQLPSGKNAVNITRTGRRYPGKRFALWKADAMRQILAQHKFDRIISAPCKMTVRYFTADKRRRDVSGMIDAVFHVLEKCMIVKDDALIVDVDWQFCGQDKENPRAEISIESGGGK